MQAAIEARAITNRTGAGEVTVRDVSLTVDSGELVALIGGTGSGKPTLLEALSGARIPTSGTVLRHPGHPLGYVPAGDSIDPDLPLARALRYTAALRGIGDVGGVAMSEALDLVGLTADAGFPLGALDPNGCWLRSRPHHAAHPRPGAPDPGPGGPHSAGRPTPGPGTGPARQLSILVRRDAEVFARARRQVVILAAAATAMLFSNRYERRGR